MSKYYRAEDVQELITACVWRMTLAKERSGEGFVEYDKQIIDVGELEKRLSYLPTIEVMEYPQVDGITPTVITPEVSEDAISREWLLEEYQKGKEKISESECFAELMWLVKHAPSVIPKPKEGEWINKQEKYRMAECSNCKKVTMQEMCGDKIVYYDYCPNCGEKMKGADDERSR